MEQEPRPAHFGKKAADVLFMSVVSAALSSSSSWWLLSFYNSSTRLVIAPHSTTLTESARLAPSVQRNKNGQWLGKRQRIKELKKGYSRNLNIQIGLDGSRQIGISAGIGIGLGDESGVLADQKTDRGIKGSGGSRGRLDSANLKTGFGRNSAAEHGKHGQEEGKDGGSHYG